MASATPLAPGAVASMRNFCATRTHRITMCSKPTEDAVTRIERNGPHEIPHEHAEPEGALAGQKKPSPRADGSRAPSTTAKAALVNRYDWVRRTLERDPAQADRLISTTLVGSSSADREIVMRALAQRGNTGLRKYADAEQVLRALRAFGKDERGDILLSMKAGTHFADAVKDERAALELPVRYETKSPVAELVAKSLANSSAQAKQVSELTRHVMDLNRKIGRMSRVAEATVGVGSAVGLVGAAGLAPAEALARRSTAPLKEVEHRTIAAGNLMAGTLSERIANANQTTLKFLHVTGNFTDARNRYERAVKGNDFEAMATASKQMAAASKEMRRLATSLANQARAMVPMKKDFDHAAVETVVTAVLTCVGLSEAAHPIHGAVTALQHAATDAAAERVVMEVIDQTSEH